MQTCEVNNVTTVPVDGWDNQYDTKQQVTHPACNTLAEDQCLLLYLQSLVQERNKNLYVTSVSGENRWCRANANSRIGEIINPGQRFRYQEPNT